MTVVYSEKAKKQLKKTDNTIKAKILDYMDEVANLENPRSRGKALVGNLLGFWRYRVEDYRLLCRIQDNELIIAVIEIGHRRDIYKSKHLYF